MPSPLNELSASAISLVHQAVADYSALERDRRLAGRIFFSMTPFGVYDLRTTQVQSALFRMCSVLEAYLDSAIEYLYGATLGDLRLAVVDKLIDEQLHRSSMTWAARTESLVSHFGIDPGSNPNGYTYWAQILGLVEARNSIAHGLGGLTRQQRRSASTVSGRLSQIGIQVEAGSLVVSDRVLGQCANRVEEFIRWLDPQLGPRR